MEAFHVDQNTRNAFFGTLFCRSSENNAVLLLIASIFAAIVLLKVTVDWPRDCCLLFFHRVRQRNKKGVIGESNP